jgi:hypothetical protein
VPLLKLPDGVDIDLPLEAMVIKDCVFIPTLKTEATREEIHRLAAKLSMKVQVKASVEEGYLGVLVWRVE